MTEPSTVPPGQAQTGTPPPGQQAQVQPPPPAPQPVVITSTEPPPSIPGQPPSSAPTAPTPEQFAQLQQQAARAAELEQRNAQLDQNYKHLQGAFTQTRQQLAAITGATQQPPPNPADQVAAILSQQHGIDPADAKRLGPAFYAVVQHAMAPLQQQLQQAQAVAQSSVTVDPIMAHAYQMAPDLFQTPGMYDQTRMALVNMASSGGQIDPQLALMTASSIAIQQRFSQPQPGYPPNVQPFPGAQPQYQVPQPIPQPYSRGMYPGMQTSFQPQPPAGPAALPADAQHVENEMRTRFNLPPKTA